MSGGLVVLTFCTMAAGVQFESPASAELCGRCHRSIHEAWNRSGHAQATTSRLFQDALALAEADSGAAARKTCLRCHAPVAVLTRDLALRNKVSWEGVTCDYCHSIQNVALSSPNAVARVQFSSVKSGPLKDAASTAHGTSFSAVHTSSMACVSCHEYRNELGFAVLTTYSEWKNSRAAQEGLQCQSCHMYRVEGQVVDPKLNRISGARVNLHQMPGSHTLAQLTRTIRANLSAAWEGERLRVVVDVVNQTAGHYVPTGSPLRQLVLQVKTDSFDGQRFQQERVYRRTVGDAAGAPLEREHLALLKAARVLSDTRLAPAEKRTEEFSFPIPAAVATQVTVTFWYVHSPAPRTGARERITFLSLSRLVHPARSEKRTP